MSARRSTAARGVLVLALLACGPAIGRAQDFATPAATAVGDLLERALPDPAGGFAFDAMTIRRPAGLVTRSLAANAAIGVVRVASGLSRTGDAALGWSTVAGGAGFALPNAGAAVRGIVRRDDGAPAGEERHGVELGLGGWLGGSAARGWISAPQVWLGGIAPPLARGVAAGLDLRSGDAFAALAREAPRRGFAEPASWTTRLGLALGGLAVWGEWRDHPFRGGVGVSASAGPVECVAQVDAHPVLDPTARIAIRVRSVRDAR